MRQMISPEELLEMAHYTENTIRRYNSLVDTMYKLAGELDDMWEGDNNYKLVSMLNNDRCLYCSLPELLESQAEVLRNSADLLKELEPGKGSNLMDIFNPKRFT